MLLYVSYRPTLPLTNKQMQRIQNLRIKWQTGLKEECGNGLGMSKDNLQDNLWKSQGIWNRRCLSIQDTKFSESSSAARRSSFGLRSITQMCIRDSKLTVLKAFVRQK